MKLIALILLLCSISQAEYYYAKSYTLNEPTDNRTKIVVIDTGIQNREDIKPYLCTGKHYDLTDTGIEDKHGHGTNIAGIIAKKMNPLTQCLLIIKYFSTDKADTFQREIEALKLVLTIPNVKFVNFSSGGQGGKYEERMAIQNIVEKGIYFVTAAGNDSQNLGLDGYCNYYPACYNFLSKFFRVVGNGTSQNKKAASSNYGGPVTDWRNGMNVDGFGIKMSGTSQSCAVMTSYLVSQ